MREERRFERVTLPESANVYAEEEGTRLGEVAILGRGGMLVRSSQGFVEGSPHRLTIVDESEQIRCNVIGVQRYEVEGATGYEFRSLDVDAAVAIGVILGKYYDRE